MIEIPRRLRRNVEEDDDPSRDAWLATLPEQIARLAASWNRPSTGSSTRT